MVCDFYTCIGIGLTLQTMTKFAYYFITVLTAQESKHGQTSSLVLLTDANPVAGEH